MGNGWTMRYYFVAFIDVLGQSRRLLSLTGLPATEDEKQKASLVLHETAGYIMALRSGFTRFFEAKSRPTGRLDSLPIDKRAIAENLRRSEVIMTSLSDTIVIAVPIDNQDDHSLSINSIYSALYGICGIFVLALAHRKPFRCGVDVGIGVPLTDREIYGEVIVKTYTLENQVALYPRIVVGDSLFNYLHMVQRLSSQSLSARFAKTRASNCIGLVTSDCDTLKILDVIGKGAQSIQGGMDKPLVEQAYKFIVEFHEVHAKSGDNKLKAHYGLLRNYFESRIGLWGIQPITSQ